MRFDAQKALILYAGVLTVAVIALLLTGVSEAEAPRRFAVIDVERINVREPDGTLRLVISNQARFPGLPVRGREYPHPNRSTAGMLFMNEEGSETGGLIWSGRQVDGVRESTGSLTFDRYEQDQVVQVFEDERGPTRSSGIRVFERPEGTMQFDRLQSILELPPEQQEAAFATANVGGRQRAFFGREANGDSSLVLRDASGRPRLRMSVSAEGVARIDFLDESGRVSRSVTPEE
jgi:hypothetical protein